MAKTPEKMWALVDKGPHPKGCWLWMGAKLRRPGQTDDDCYGYYQVNGKNWGAHRLAYTLERGPIPKGKFVLHTCDVKLCVNPEHLYVGTQRDNLLDIIERSPPRGGPGKKGRKLTPSNVREIRAALAEKRVTYRVCEKLAEEYGVSPNTIRMIHTGQTWGWLDNEEED